jgi:hypothetical protein
MGGQSCQSSFRRFSTLLGVILIDCNKHRLRLRASSLIEKKLDDFVKKSKIPLKRHSGEGRNPVISAYSGYRIKSGMTKSGIITRPSKSGNVS